MLRRYPVGRPVAESRQRIRLVKHLLSDAAIVAVSAIAVPVWNANGTDTQLAAASSMSNTSSATPPKHRHARIHHPAAHSSIAMHHHAARSSRSMAEQLNQQELTAAGGGLHPSAPRPRVREPNAGSTPVQRAMIVLESSDKSRSPMLTERIKA